MIDKPNDDNPHRGRNHRVRKFFKELGPGLITGAADDDPSGISTYSVTGASFGYLSLWTAVISFPLMTSVQLMCARLGLVTGRGLASVIRIHQPRWVLWMCGFLLIVANVFNIGADLAGMAEATEMVTGVPSYFWTPVYTLLIISLLLFTTYKQIAKILKWLTLILFAYVITAFLSKPDWSLVLYSTFVPRIVWTPDFLATIVAIFGTTISPYLFFWQASQEVEAEKALGRTTVEMRQGCTNEDLTSARNDVMTGMLVSNLVMFFIILTTAATLNAAGKTDIQTARDAAEALRPLAGNSAYLLFTLGLIGTGILGVPVLAGSAAYALSEAANWSGSLEDRPTISRRFYSVILIALLLGMGLDFIGLNAVQMLFYSAVLNGVLAPPLVVVVILLTNSKKVMGDRVNSPIMRIFGWLTVAVMTFASLGAIVAGIL